MKTFTANDLLNYLQSQMDDFQENLKKFGPENVMVEYKCSAMIACKEMVEALICEPVNLQKDGRVTVGF